MAVQHFMQRTVSIKITTITAVALSHCLPEGKTVTMGVGSILNCDGVIVRVKTSESITGCGEAHLGGPGAVTSGIHNTRAQLLVGIKATDAVGA